MNNVIRYTPRTVVALTQLCRDVITRSAPPWYAYTLHAPSVRVRVAYLRIVDYECRVQVCVQPDSQLLMGTEFDPTLLDKVTPLAWDYAIKLECEERNVTFTALSDVVNDSNVFHQLKLDNDVAALFPLPEYNV